MARYDGKLMNIGRQATHGHFAGEKHTLSTNVWLDGSIAAADTFYFGKLPKGAVITGGRIYSGRLCSGTTSACASMSICLGIDQICYNASGTSFSTASLTSALGFFSPIDFRPNGVSQAYTTRAFDSGFEAPFGGVLLVQGPLTVQSEANIFATVVSVGQSSSGISGNLNIELDYLVGQMT